MDALTVLCCQHYCITVRECVRVCRLVFARFVTNLTLFCSFDEHCPLNTRAWEIGDLPELSLSYTHTHAHTHTTVYPNWPRECFGFNFQCVASFSCVRSLALCVCVWRTQGISIVEDIQMLYRNTLGQSAPMSDSKHVAQLTVLEVPLAIQQYRIIATRPSQTDTRAHAGTRAHPSIRSSRAGHS